MRGCGSWLAGRRSEMRGDALNNPLQAPDVRNPDAEVKLCLRTADACIRRIASLRGLSYSDVLLRWQRLVFEETNR